MSDQRTAGSSDAELKERIAGEVFAAIRYGIESNATDIPGVLSCKLIPNVSPLRMTLRLRVDHGSPRGQKYHLYTIRLSEGSA